MSDDPNSQRTNIADGADDDIEMTVIRSDDPLTKTFALDEHDNPRKINEPFLSTGTAHRHHVRSASFANEFREVLELVDANRCLVLGPISADVAGDVANITTRKRHSPREMADGSPLVWRGDAWMGYRSGRRAVFGIDHDPKDLPAPMRQKLDEQGGLLTVLETICPAIRGVARVSRPSTSTGIRATASGATSAGGGLHLYLPVNDGGNVKEFVAKLHDYLVLNGWGFAFISKVGSVQIRSLVDTAASGLGSRLWFEGAAILSDGLEHVPNARDIHATSGSILDTESALDFLVGEQADRLQQIQSDLRTAVAGEAAEKQQQYSDRVRAAITERGEDPETTGEVVRNLLDADARGILHGRHILHLDDGRVVTVSDVLANRSQFHRATCADPFDSNHGQNRNKAIIFTDGHQAKLYTHRHGGRLYTLAYDESDFRAIVGTSRAEGKSITEIVQKHLPDLELTAGYRRKTTLTLTSNLATVLGLDLRNEPVSATVSPADATDPDTVTSSQSLNPDMLDPNPAIDALMREFNAEFAVVPEGGTTSIVRLAHNAELGIKAPVSMSPDSFKLLYSHRRVEIPRRTRSGEIELQAVPAPQIWLNHEKRRTCLDGFGMDPTGTLPASCFNLWQGFGVYPKPGDWSKFATLIRDVIAAGDETNFEYILQWLAHLAQRPHENPGVALVLRGPEGAGKGTFASGIMRMMAPHAMQISHAKHFTGAFNSHLRTVLLPFADEAFFAGDRANEGVLKALITEDFRVTEGKGRDATLGRNRLHLMMASNETWVVPASAEARRFAVFDVSPVHMQDLNYFKAVRDEMDLEGEAGGIAGMLYDLLRYPLDMNIVRKAPETAGLQSQRISSLRGPARWLFDVLNRGRVSAFSGDSWQDWCPTDDLLESYRSWSISMKESYPSDSFAIGKVLSAIFKPYRPRLTDQTGAPHRPPSYRLGSLNSARAAFAAQHKLGNPWNDDPNEDVGPDADPT